MAERAKLKSTIIDSSFLGKPKVKALAVEHGDLAVLAYIACLLDMSGATDGEVDRAVALSNFTRYGSSREEAAELLDYCLARGLFSAGSESHLITNSRIVREMEEVAAKRVAWKAKKRKQRDKLETPKGHPRDTEGDSVELSENSEKSEKEKDLRSSERGTGGKPKRPPVADPPLTFPPHLDYPDCRKAWADWVEFKATEKRERYKTAKTQNIAIAEAGSRCPTPREFIAAINFSISSRYSGIFPPPASRNGSARSAANRTRDELDEAFSELIPQGER